MAIGERIRYFRSLLGMTQKYLGLVAVYPEKSANTRMAQYESGSRRAKSGINFCIVGGTLCVPVRWMYRMLTVMLA